jgi:glycosyltransferase involved in cell wall biosynthesis
MRALTVLESVSRADGGIFEAERSLQCALAKTGVVEVRVVGLRDGFTEADAVSWGALRPRVAEVLGPMGIGYAPGFAGLLDTDVDLAYAATLWKYPSWAVLNWQKKTGKPVVVAPHGSLDAWALNNSRWKKRLAAWFFKDEQLRRATCFRALCEAEADAIRAYGLPQRIEIIPNGVELPDLLTTEDTESTEGKKRLLFLGRIHPKKGLVGALRAWADIQNSKSKIQNSKQWQFVIAGWDQGGHEAELKALCAELGLRIAVGTTKDTNSHEMEEAGLRLAGQAGAAFSNPSTSKLARDSENTSLTRSASAPASALDSSATADVLFFGPAFGEAKELLLRNVDAFILPSFSEGLPMSVLEAWAYGLPVVMTPECNLPEGFASHAALEIRSGEGSFEGADFSFQQGLRMLLEMSDHERAAMGMRGRRLVEEKFTWQKVAAQMLGLYEDVLGR